MSRAASGWNADNLVQVLKGLGLFPQRTTPEPGDDVRIIVAHDPATALNFGVLYLAGPEETMNELSLICVIPAPSLDTEAAAAINARLQMASAFLEDNQLWVYAELNTSQPFAAKFFQAQVEFFLRDVALSVQLLMNSGGLSLKAARAFLSIKDKRGADAPMVRALSNDVAISRREERTAVHTAAAEFCLRCGGTGRLLLRACGDCGGSGEAVKQSDQ